MIVVFVIDTSPSMGKPLVECTNDDNNRDSSSMSRLDLAKMAVEEVLNPNIGCDCLFRSPLTYYITSTGKSQQQT